MPTRADVDLARAAIDHGFLTVEESIKCLKIQRDHDQNGRQVSLEQILVEEEFLTPRHLAGLKESLAKSAALRHIGHYEIVSKVGAGGMGTVYKARDTKADRVVALKVLSPGHASNKEYIQRFLREARASGQLSHPNIVQGYDAGEANGQYYFAMEFIDGITVGHMLKDGRPIPEQQALDIAIQIAKALEHAEEHDIVHRDVKPDNIMITNDGTAKLADLGLARMKTGEPAARDKKAFGTVYYASPEQCEGVDELDSKSDMYSFGATLFHMLAARVPFDDDSPEGILAKHVEEKPAYLKDLDVQLSHGISKIVRKLMAKDKRGRYPGMADVARDLTLVRMGRSPRLGHRARHDSGEYRYRSATGSWRTKRPSRQKRITQVSVCVAVGLVLIGGGYLLLRPAPPKQPDPARNKAVVPPDDSRAGPRPDHEISLDDLLAERQELPREGFYRKLRSVARNYPGTTSAEKARKLADTLLRQIVAEARPKFDERTSEAIRLRGEQRYQAALDELGKFPPEYNMTRFGGEVKDLRSSIRSRSESEFAGIQARARRFEKQHKYLRAIALYVPVVKKFGIPKMRSRAEAETRRLGRARAKYERKLAKDAERKAEQERIRRDRAMMLAALKDAVDLAGRSRFAEAAGKLDATAKKLQIKENSDGIAQAVKDLDKAQTLLDGLQTATRPLRNKDAAITLRDGTKLEGTILGVRKKGLSLQCAPADGTPGRVETVPWQKLSPRSIKTLVALSRGPLGPDERCAIAAMFYFAGKQADAKAELDKLAADPKHKGAVALRRAYIELFRKAKPE